MINKIIIKFLLFSLIFINAFFVVKVYWGDNFSDIFFTVDVKNITSGIWMDSVSWGTLDSKANNLFDQIREILMVAIWVISLFVVSIWAWYMIFYNWKEEFLTKWRSMIYTGFLALFIALTSYYIMNFVRYILYN